MPAGQPNHFKWHKENKKESIEWVILSNGMMSKYLQSWLPCTWPSHVSHYRIMAGHNPTIQPQFILALFTTEILLWKFCKFHCPKFSHFQKRLKWHPLKFTKCHLKGTPHLMLLFSFRESEKGWRYLNS